MTMKADRYWLLEAASATRVGGPFDPPYHVCFSMVVCAPSESDARAIAQANGGDETGRRNENGDYYSPWLEPRYTTCTELRGERPTGVICEEVYEP